VQRFHDHLYQSVCTAAGWHAAASATLIDPSPCAFPVLPLTWVPLLQAHPGPAVKYVAHEAWRTSEPGTACRARTAGMGVANDSAHIANPGDRPLSSPFACSNLRWGIGSLPRQTGVYVPRRLSQVSGSVRAPGPGRPRRLGVAGQPRLPRRKPCPPYTEHR
jgi:hypothetical protein